MYGRSVAVGHIINAVHRLNEKLITIWKSEGSHDLVYHRYLGTRVPTDLRFFDPDARAERELQRGTCYQNRTMHMCRVKLWFHSSRWEDTVRRSRNVPSRRVGTTSIRFRATSQTRSPFTSDTSVGVLPSLVDEILDYSPVPSSR